MEPDRSESNNYVRLSYLGHVVTENRHGLIAEAMTTHADGTAEADAALLMLQDLAKSSSRITVGADKAYDVAGLVSVLRELNVTPHVIQNNKNRRSAPCGIRDQFGQTLAGGKGLRLAETNRTATQGEVTGPTQSGLVVLIQLRCLQPVTHSKTKDTVCLNANPIPGYAARSFRSGHRTPST